MSSVRENVNAEFGTSYTEENFVGTNFYRVYYALMQKVQENEVKTAEIFLKLQQYISQTNEEILRPSVSHPGLIDAFEDAGFTISVKQPEAGDAGKIFICLLLDDGADDYDAQRLQACTLIKDFVVGGLVSDGSETEDITLSNGQSFTFGFNLPDPTPVILKLTAVQSQNTPLTVPSDEDIRQAVFDNINSKYRLGWNFEPQRYFTLADAPWAGSVLLEWSDDAGANWHSTVFTADYTDLYTFGLEDIEVVLT